MKITLDEVVDDEEDSYNPSSLDDDETDDDIYTHDDLSNDGSVDDDDQHGMPYEAPGTNIRDEMPPSMDDQDTPNEVCDQYYDTFNRISSKVHR